MMLRRTFFAMILLAAGSLFAADNQELVMELESPGAKTLHIVHMEKGLKVKEFPGKVILFNFFGKQCPYCWKEIPHLVELQKKYKEKLQVIAIHSQRPMTPQERLEMQQSFKFNYPIYEYMEGDNALFVEYIAKRTGWQSTLPYSVVFDPYGNFVYAFNGYAPMSDLEKVIDFAINKSGKTAKSGKK